MKTRRPENPVFNFRPGPFDSVGPSTQLLKGLTLLDLHEQDSLFISEQTPNLSAAGTPP